MPCTESEFEENGLLRLFHAIYMGKMDENGLTIFGPILAGYPCTKRRFHIVSWHWSQLTTVDWCSCLQGMTAP